MLVWNDIMYIAKSSLIVTKNELCNYETIVWKKTEGLENLHFWNFNFQNQQDGSYFIEF